MFKNAVYSLLQEESTISNLTVQKIANEAGLNRTTFYLHYQDIQDLLMQLTDEILNELSNKITALIHVSNLSEKQQLTQLLDYLYIHRNYLSVLFNMNHFEEQLFLLIKKLVETRRNNSETELPEDYVAIEIKTASLVGIIMWWIKTDFILVQIILQTKFISCTEDNDCRLFTNRMRLEHMSPISLRRKTRISYAKRI